MPEKLKDEDIIKVDGGLIILKEGIFRNKVIVKNDITGETLGEFSTIKKALEFAKKCNVSNILRYQPR